jgi:tetratricopeptide (TPR) repeat protein
MTGATAFFTTMNPKNHLLIACLLGVCTAHAAPTRPSDDNAPLDRSNLPQGALQTTAPKNLNSAVDLALRYIELGRGRADGRFYGYAEAAVAPWYNLPNPPTSVRYVRAVVLQYNHRFDESLADLNEVLRAEPNNVQARLTAAVVQTVIGRYADARASCAALAKLDVVPLAVTACSANANSMNGQAAESYAALEAAVKAAPDAQSSLRLWAYTLLGEIAERLGRDTEADSNYRKALAITPGDSYLLAAYSDFLLDHKRPAEVTRLLVSHATDGNLLLRLALAEQAQHGPKLAEYTNGLRSIYQTEMLRGDHLHLREDARFNLLIEKNPANALKLALENWPRQHEAWDIRVLIATANAAGKPDAAKPALDWVRQNHYQDVRLNKPIS